MVDAPAWMAQCANHLSTIFYLDFEVAYSPSMKRHMIVRRDRQSLATPHLIAVGAFKKGCELGQTLQLPAA